MTPLQFENVIDESLQKIKEILIVKAREYRRNDNPFHNFEVAARKKNETRERALYGMAMKHTVSIDDIRNDLDCGKLPSRELVEEKFTDALNYLLLEKASLLDRINIFESTKNDG